jgi:hypothetical protein
MSVHKRWRPQRDSNPCFGLERAASWASGRWGHSWASEQPVILPSACRIGETERVTAVLAHVLRVSAAPHEEPYPVRPEETDDRVADLPEASARLEKAVPAVARVFDEAFALGDFDNAVTEKAAGVPHLFPEGSSSDESIRGGGKYQRMATADAHVLVHAVAIGKPHVHVMPKKARERVPDVCDRPVLAEILGPAAAPPRARRRQSEVRIVNGVPPHRTAESNSHPMR